MLVPGNMNYVEIKLNGSPEICHNRDIQHAKIPVVKKEDYFVTSMNTDIMKSCQRQAPSMTFSHLQDILLCARVNQIVD